MGVFYLALVEYMATRNIQSDNTAGLPTSPIVIVGSGPVGVRTVQELHRLAPTRPLVIYGDEPWEPYNRVRLTQMLAGHSTWAEVFQSLQLPDVPSITKRYNCPVVEVDIQARRITDGLGNTQSYSHLVLAVGSRPFVPNLSGRDLNGVYTLRNMSDVQGLLARRVRTRRTIVVGGGLLGIEAARALQRSHTEVGIVQHGGRLLGQQLDDIAANMMRQQIEALGISVYLNDGAHSILGDRLVEGIRLRSGREIECDTVVFATGIAANTELARKIGLRVGRGIKVDDQLRTSDPSIYAVGECTEHRGKVYGLVAPGLEQASVLAHHLVGNKASYKGSIAAARLKVINTPVFSIGDVTDEQVSNLSRQLVYEDKAKGIYRKLVIKRGRLIGAIAIGEGEQLGRLQEAVTFQRRVWPWQQLRFKKFGELWPGQDAADVSQWPAMATVCNCTGVTRGALSAAIAGGCKTVESLAECTGASTVCGSCKPKLVQLIGQGEPVGVNNMPRVLMAVSLIGMLLALLTFLLTPIAMPNSVQYSWHLSDLWQDSLMKQITGFTLLGLSVIGLLVSLRKRVKWFGLAQFSSWRMLHVVLGLVALIVLLLHTGLRMGDNLNFYLMLSFCGLALVGAVAGVASAYEVKRPSLAMGRWRRCSTWTHIFLFWPLPVLLGFHILKTYFY